MRQGPQQLCLLLGECAICALRFQCGCQLISQLFRHGSAGRSAKPRSSGRPKRQATAGAVGARAAFCACWVAAG